MMMDPTLVITAACLVGICVVAFALLQAWRGWLELKRQELDRAARGPAAPEIEGGASAGAARIELADMKERIKKLEAIASGVEL
jgi:hypothetical protein